jgi:hypothetical protein
VGRAGASLVNAVTRFDRQSPTHPLLRDWLDTAAPPLAGTRVLLVGGPDDAAALVRAGATLATWDEAAGGAVLAVIAVIHAMSVLSAATQLRQLAVAVAPGGFLLLIASPAYGRTGRNGADAFDSLRRAGLVLDTYEDLEGAADPGEPEGRRRHLRIMFRRPIAGSSLR